MGIFRSAFQILFVIRLSFCLSIVFLTLILNVHSLFTPSSWLFYQLCSIPQNHQVANTYDTQTSHCWKYPPGNPNEYNACIQNISSFHFFCPLPYIADIYAVLFSFVSMQASIIFQPPHLLILVNSVSLFTSSLSFTLLIICAFLPRLQLIFDHLVLLSLLFTFLWQLMEVGVQVLADCWKMERKDCRVGPWKIIIQVE